MVLVRVSSTDSKCPSAMFRKNTPREGVELHNRSGDISVCLLTCLSAQLSFCSPVCLSVCLSGVDDAESECGLDSGVEFDWMITNEADAPSLDEQLQPILKLAKEAADNH